MIKKLFVLIASVLFTISAFAQTPVIGPVGLSGVLSINSSTGDFTFTGSGVSCTGTTCTFTGGSGTVNSGTTGQLAYYGANGTAVQGAPGVTTDGAGGLTASTVAAGAAISANADQFYGDGIGLSYGSNGSEFVMPSTYSTDAVVNNASIQTTAGSVWVRQGSILSSVAGIDTVGPEEPTVIYDTTCPTTSASNCYRMIFTAGDGIHLYYAESVDGQTNWIRRSAPVAPGRGAFWLKNGGTYYLYSFNGGLTTLNRYTSSDGLTWTLATANVMPLTTESEYGNLAIYVYSGTWYMAYEGVWSGTSFSMGAATSSDGITWTKNVGNPLIVNGGQGASLYRDGGGNWWMWGHCCGGTPSDIFRYTSTDFVTWTRNTTQPTFLRQSVDEGVGLAGGQVADPSLVTIGSNTNLYYTATRDQSSFSIKLATTAATQATLVTEAETSVVGGGLQVGNSGAGTSPLTLSSDGINATLASTNSVKLSSVTPGGSDHFYLNDWIIGLDPSDTYMSFYDPAVQKIFQLDAGAGMGGGMEIPGYTYVGWYRTAGVCVSTASPAACAAKMAGIVQVAAATSSLEIDSTTFTASTGCWFTYDVGGITPPANMSSLLQPYISSRTAGTSITITLPVAPTTNPINVQFGCIN